MRILSLDLATKTGWALWDGARIESGMQDFTKGRGESNGMVFLKFNTWLASLKTATHRQYPDACFDLIAFEQAHHRGGAATEIAVGLMTRVLEFCARYGIEHTSVHSLTLKKWATGSGKADKETMKVKASLAVARTIEDDNEADAVLILTYALEKFGGDSCNVRLAAAAEAK